MSAQSTSTPKTSSWITTWKPWGVNPGRCPAPPRWSRPALRAPSPIHQRFWDGARAAVGDQRGTKALVEVLLLHRTLPAPALEAVTPRAAVRVGGAGRAAPHRRPRRRRAGVSWNTANTAVLAEGKRVLIDDPTRFDGVTATGVDEHVVRHEALLFRMEVRDLHGFAVVAVE